MERGSFESYDVFHYNVPSDLMIAFSTPGRPISLDEWTRFWNSLTPQEKHYYRHVDIYGSKR
jgi:hypothetical protein